MFQGRLTNTIEITLGKGYPTRAIVSSLSLAIIVLFYSLSTASYFRPDVYRFEDRTTYHQYFEDRYLISEVLDSLFINISLLVWIYFSFVNRMKYPILLTLAILILFGIVGVNLSVDQFISIFSLPFIFVIYIINKKKKIFRKSLQIESSPIAFNYFLISFMVLALISIFLSMSRTTTHDPFVDIMTLLSRYTPIIMVLVIFCVFVRAIFNQILLIVPVWIRSKVSVFSESFNVQNQDFTKLTKVILLSCIMLLSAFIVLIPHLDGQQNKVAEDTTIYAKWIEPMKDSKDISELLRLAFMEIRIASAGDRPISLLILHGLSSIFDTVFAFEILLPALLAPMLALVMYYLTKELTGNILASFFSSFISAVSFQVMIGMYAGFYANWIALIFGYISVLLALRYLHTRDKKSLVCLSIAMIALLFSHVYTWTLITAFFIIFLLVLRWKRLYDSRSIMVVLTIVIAVFITDIARSYLIGLSSGLQSDIVIAESFNFGLSQMGLAWSNIVRAVEVHQGGIFGNIIILSLAFYYAFLVKYKTASSLFVIVFLSIGILPLLFGDKTIQTRVLYNIPFQIPAALALTSIFTSNKGKLISIVIVVSLLAISIYIMNNLGVAPR